MKKLTMVALVLAMAFAVAGGASAFYVWNVAGSDASGGNFSSGTVGVVATTSQTAYSQSGTKNLVWAANLITNTGVPASGSTVSNLWKNNRNAVAPAGDKWFLEVFAEPSYPGGANMELRIWASATSNTPAGAWNVYKLYDPITNVWGREQVNLTDVNKGTAGASVSAPWFKYSMPTKNVADPSGTIQGYVFELSPQVIPEPGSMVALMSGLVGLVGFGIRRRK